jgi:hypothetical protein
MAAPDGRPASLKAYTELTDEERAERAQRRALEYLDRPRMRRTPAEVRLLASGDGYWEMIADFMEAELAAREARKGFRAVRGCGLPGERRYRTPGTGRRPSRP